MIDDLRRRWNETEPFSPFRPLYDLISFIKDWLVLGDSVVLARRIYSERGEPDLLFKGGQERVLTLLSLAYMRPMPARVLDHLRRAARDWGRGETCLAYIHLAFGHLNKLRDPEEAAFRLFVADEYLNIGVSARDLLDAFGLDRGPGALLEKYSPDQPRVPAGYGRQSGQWTDGGAVASPPVQQAPPPPARSAAPAAASAAAPAAASAPAVASAAVAAGADLFFVEDLAPIVLAGLSEITAGLSAPALALGVLFIPSPGDGSVVDGAVPGAPDLLYHWDRQAGEIVFSWSIAGIAVPFNSASMGAGGLYYDPGGRAIARAVGGALIINAAAATAGAVPQRADEDEQSQIMAPPQAAAIANDNNPRLCPDPGLDKPHGASAAADAYETRITGLPKGVAVWLNGVFFDGCRESDGTMLEAKADYDQFIDNETGGWKWWFTKTGAVTLATQLESQSFAAGPRMVEWHVAQPRPAALITKMAEPYSNIIVMWDP